MDSYFPASNCEVTIEDFLWSAFHATPEKPEAMDTKWNEESIFDTVPELDIDMNNCTMLNKEPSMTDLVDQFTLNMFHGEQPTAQAYEQADLLNETPSSIFECVPEFMDTMFDQHVQQEQEQEVQQYLEKKQMVLPIMPVKRKRERETYTLSSLQQDIESLNFEDVTVQELKALLKKCGLSGAGKKTELIVRLKRELENIKARRKYAKVFGNVSQNASSNVMNAVSHMNMMDFGSMGQTFAFDTSSFLVQ